MASRKKFVRSYLKERGVTPTRDAASRSTRERRLRGKAREAYAAMGTKKTRKTTPTTGRPVDRLPENRAKVDKAERRRQERMRPAVDREAKRQKGGYKNPSGTSRQGQAALKDLQSRYRKRGAGSAGGRAR